MKNKEINYFDNVVCPFCMKVLVNKELVEEYKICEHTIFVATDSGFEYIREDMKDFIDEETEETFDDYTSNLPIQGIRLAEYAPAPSFFGAYWGFKLNELDSF